MPRISWEQAHEVEITRADRRNALRRLRHIAAEEITHFDPSFVLKPTKHTVTDISVRDEDAEGDKDVIVTIRGMHKTARVDHSKDIGDAIRTRGSQIFEALGLTWSLSLCWDEYYYNDGEEE